MSIIIYIWNALPQLILQAVAIRILPDVVQQQQHLLHPWRRIDLAALADLLELAVAAIHRRLPLIQLQLLQLLLLLLQLLQLPQQPQTAYKSSSEVPVGES